MFVWVHVVTVWFDGDSTEIDNVDHEKYLSALSKVILVFHDVRYTSLLWASKKAFNLPFLNIIGH